MDTDKQYTPECPDCDSTRIGTIIQTQNFLYGVVNQVVLSVEVPVRVCLQCGFQFTDGEAEDIRDAAVQAHLRQEKP